MKLMYCDKCHDIVKLTKESRKCDCGQCEGFYIDDINVKIINGIPLGIANSTFVEALKNKHKFSDIGYTFVAFVIPPNASTVWLVKGDSENDHN